MYHIFHVIVLYKIILLGRLIVWSMDTDITYGSHFSLFLRISFYQLTFSLFTTVSLRNITLF